MPEEPDSTAKAFADAMRQANSDPPKNQEVAVEPTREGLMAVELRRRGVRCTSSHPDLIALCTDGFTVPEMVETLALASMQDTAPKPMNLGYLATVARTQREVAKRPKRADASWWSTEMGIQRKAAELGMTARGGESWIAFTGRIRERIAKEPA